MENMLTPKCDKKIHQLSPDLKVVFLVKTLALCSAGWCRWLVLIFCERKILLAGSCWWLVLVSCERKILLAGCSEDEANRVIVVSSNHASRAPIPPRQLTRWTHTHRPHCHTPRPPDTNHPTNPPLHWPDVPVPLDATPPVYCFNGPTRHSQPRAA